MSDARRAATWLITLASTLPSSARDLMRGDESDDRAGTAPPPLLLPPPLLRRLASGDESPVLVVDGLSCAFSMFGSRVNVSSVRAALADDLPEPRADDLPERCVPWRELARDEPLGLVRPGGTLRKDATAPLISSPVASSMNASR